MIASNLRLWRLGLPSAAEQALKVLLGCAALFVAYFALGQLNQAFIFPPRNHAIFWMSSGLAVAWFLRTPPSRWPAWCLAIFGAEAWVCFRNGLPPSVSLAWGAAACLPPLVGGWLVRPPAGHRFVFAHVGDVVRLALLGAVVGALPGALIAAAANVIWLEAGSYWTKVVTWWSSDALGVILLCPFFLAWTEPTWPRVGRTVETLAFLVLLTSAGWWVFATMQPRDIDAALPFLLLPLIAWPALRFGARGATAATVILDLMAIWYTLHERGPFSMLSIAVGTRVLNLQLYIAFLNLFVLILAVVVVKEKQARAAAEKAEQRARFLAAASESLSASLDYAVSLSALPQLCVQSLSDWCVLDIVEGNTLRRLGCAHRDPSKMGLLVELTERYAPDSRSPQPAAQVLRTGEPLLLSRVTDELIRTYSVDRENARLIRELGTRTAMAVPLAIHGKMVGVLTLASANPGLSYGPTDLVFADELGRRAAIAIDNARLYRNAQDAIRLREEFLLIASHELKTPIHGLQLALQTLKRGAATVPAASSSIARVERQVRKIARLIEELLDVSRIEAGRMSVELEDVDLSAVVRDVAERFSEELSQATCPLALHAEQVVVGHWDQFRLEQVITNLLANAIKFGHGHPIEVSVGKADGTAKLVVRDHGIGVPPDRLPHIFGRFERAVSTRFYGGLGLGLYITRSIVEALGGSIKVESTMGSGATFTVELPCAGPPPLALKPDAS